MEYPGGTCGVRLLSYVKQRAVGKSCQWGSADALLRELQLRRAYHEIKALRGQFRFDSRWCPREENTSDRSVHLCIGSVYDQVVWAYVGSDSPIRLSICCR